MIGFFRSTCRHQLLSAAQVPLAFWMPLVVTDLSWNLNHPDDSPPQNEPLNSKKRTVTVSFGEFLYLFICIQVFRNETDTPQIRAASLQGLIRVVHAFIPCLGSDHDAGPEGKWIGNSQGMQAPLPACIRNIKRSCLALWICRACLILGGSTSCTEFAAPLPHILDPDVMKFFRDFDILRPDRFGLNPLSASQGLWYYCNRLCPLHSVALLPKRSYMTTNII